MLADTDKIRKYFFLCNLHFFFYNWQNLCFSKTMFLIPERLCVLPLLTFFHIRELNKLFSRWSVLSKEVKQDFGSFCLSEQCSSVPQAQCQDVRKRKELELQILTEAIRSWEGDDIKTLGNVIYMSQVLIQCAGSEVLQCMHVPQWFLFHCAESRWEQW